MHKPSIVLLCGSGLSTQILYNALITEYNITAVIMEDAVPMKQFLKKRIKKLGIIKVASQVLFQGIVAKYLEATSKNRKAEIQEVNGLDDSPIPASVITRVPSVNDAACLALLQQLSPVIVVVNGTRIISKNILNAVPAKFVNMHVGITPKYRGVHGAYWANVKNDPEHCGVTVHLVDAGIDTGGVICQQKIVVTKADNFSTYPLLQLDAGIGCMKKAISDILNNRLRIIAGTKESHLWTHPGFFEYLYYRWRYGKK